MIPGNPSAALMAVEAEAARVRAAAEAEEERMTPYTPHELTTGCEFKIIRSPRNLFGRQEYRERILAEEGRTGWVLVEVFDNGRIRLRRPRPSGHPEPIEGYDPYRSLLDDRTEPIDPAIRVRQKVLGVGCLAILAIGAVIAILVGTGVIR